MLVNGVAEWSDKLRVENKVRTDTKTDQITHKIEMSQQGCHKHEKGSIHREYAVFTERPAALPPRRGLLCLVAVAGGLELFHGMAPGCAWKLFVAMCLLCAAINCNARGVISSSGRIELASVCAFEDSFPVRTGGLSQALRTSIACVRALGWTWVIHLAKQVQLPIKVHCPAWLASETIIPGTIVSISRYLQFCKCGMWFRTALLFGQWPLAWHSPTP